MSEHMPFVHDDGGRSAAGFKGGAGDCVARSIAIASGRPYAEVYAALADGMGSNRKTRRTRASSTRRSARNGVLTRRKWFKDYMRGLGFEWTPTMKIGQGCRVHLVKGELPAGRLVVAVSKHYTAVIDGVVHDTFDPQRTIDVLTFDTEGRGRVTSSTERCVYGYWRYPAQEASNNVA